MIKVIDWLKANKLTLNIDKIHFVLFRRQRKLANLTQSFIVSGQIAGSTNPLRTSRPATPASARTLGLAG